MTTLIARPDRLRRAAHSREFLSLTHQRLMMLLLAFLLIVAVIVARILTFAMFDEGAGKTRVAQAFVPPRGDIVDRNGVPLSRTMEAYAIRVVPDRLINDKVELARQLSHIFPDTTTDQFLARMSGKPTYIRRRALPEQVAAVNALGEIGFEYPREQERLYPQLSLGAHILGFTDAAGHGVTGAERAFDARLRDPALRAAPLELSIDARVQSILESELGAAVTNLEALGGAGVLLDTNTGEVVAMASLPTFNPNQVGASGLAARRNAVTHNVYELGSTFKPLTVAAAIDAGTVTSMARRYDATQPVQVAGFRIRDSHPLGRWLNVPEMLMHSSNIVTARVADELGRAPMEAMFRKLDFDKRPAIELPERSATLWPRSWGRVTTMTTAYGHGIAVTPLHLASAYAALVNGGIYRPATILKVDGRTPPQGTRVFKPATSARMRQLLRLIVAEGTGRKADAPGYRIGGKTGSAEKPSAGGYARHSVVATFSAAFPMDNPRYVLIVMIDEPKGNAYSSGQRTAAWTAAPVVKAVVTRAGPMLGIIPDERRDVDVSDLVPLIWKAKGEQ